MTAQAKTFVIKADHENNAEEWWDALRDHGGGPLGEAIDVLLAEGELTVGEVQLAQLMSHFRSLPGWSDGPSYAPHPVLVCEVDAPYGYAAIGDDGNRPVVWGLGRTEEEAERDAAEQEGSNADRVVPVTAFQYARINAGDVSAEGL